tara:strand:+ start:467 stop:1048 length:582 start_codon:yes stop_codon:yes gene_type:complete
MITDSQWAQIQKKYKRLMYAVSHRIGGDKIANDFDDSQQELAITTMDAVDAYSRKTGLEFDEFFGTIPFDKYIKTCLWNKKNNLGNKIKKKYKIRSYISISENPELFSTGTGTTFGSSSLEVEAPLISAFDDAPLDTLCRGITTAVTNDVKIIKPDGSLNISKLSRQLNSTKQEIRGAIARLKFQLQDYNENL